MNAKEFEQIVNERCQKIRDVLTAKAKEYASDKDRLHNFNRGAQITGQTRERVLHGFMMKHFISYLDILDNVDKGIYPSHSLVDEKIGDIINYFILMEACLKGCNKGEDGQLTPGYIAFFSSTDLMNWKRGCCQDAIAGLTGELLGEDGLIKIKWIYPMHSGFVFPAMSFDETGTIHVVDGEFFYDAHQKLQFHLPESRRIKIHRLSFVDRILIKLKLKKDIRYHGTVGDFYSLDEVGKIWKPNVIERFQKMKTSLQKKQPKRPDPNTQ